MRPRKLALVIVSKENNPCQIVDVNVAANWWLNSNNIKEKNVLQYQIEYCTHSYQRSRNSHNEFCKKQN